MGNYQIFTSLSMLIQYTFYWNCYPLEGQIIGKTEKLKLVLIKYSYIADGIVQTC